MFLSSGNSQGCRFCDIEPDPIIWAPRALRGLKDSSTPRRFSRVLLQGKPLASVSVHVGGPSARGSASASIAWISLAIVREAPSTEGFTAGATRRSDPSRSGPPAPGRAGPLPPRR